jgi:delta24(24(1))-sterol reductase
MEQNGSFIVRNTFPQLPYGHIKNPSYIKTEHGNLLLTDGWWGVVRKPHYTADLVMAASWGLITGFGSFLPYFYVCFFICVLTHRVTRDMERCAKKYGKDWDRYCERVPYIFIPYVF